MIKKEDILQEKRKIEHYLPASYFGRLLVLEILLAFLLVSEFPGFDAQKTLPMGLFVIIVAFIYFVLINGIRMLINRFLAFLIPKTSLEILLFIINFHYLDKIVRQGESIGLSDEKFRFVFVLWTLLSLVSFASIGYFLRKKENRGKKLLIAWAISIFFLILPAYYSFSQGFDRSPKTEEPLAYKNMDYQAKFPVEEVDYGPGLGLDFGKENLSHRAYLSKWRSRLRKKLLGHNLKDIPYRGRIFLPKGRDKVAFIVFVHGNHNMIEDNMGGYDYLGRFLASQGYGFISIDQSVFNGYMGKGTGNENDARAIFLLQHAEKIVEESQKKTSPLYNRLDKEKIILGGHSRGGEAAAIGAHFNALTYLPDEGKKKKENDLRVRGVLAVAPTYGQYLPSDRPVDLEDVSYLLVHGSHDQDVNTLQGMDQYRHLSFTKGEGNFKAQVLVSKANHGQFNENWGRRDKSLPSGFYLNTKDLLKARDQEKILEVYSLNFLQVIDGKKDREIFADSKNFENFLPSTKYYSRYQKDSTKIIAGFEEDNRLETGSIAGVKIQGQELSTWREEAFCSSANERSEEHVFYGNPSKGKSLEILLPRGLMKEKGSIALDVAFSSKASPIIVELEDNNGQVATASSQGRKKLFGPEQTGLSKWQHLAQKWQEKNALQSLDFSLSDFKKNNPKISLKAINKIRIYSPSSAYIYLDNIGVNSFN